MNTSQILYNAPVSVSTKQYSTLTIRGLGKNEKEDERIYITPVWENDHLMCNVKHKDSDHSYKSSYYIEDIYHYVNTVLKLIIADKDACKLYQFDIPGIPSILVKHEDIPSIMDTVLNYVYYLCHNENSWMKHESKVTVQKPVVPVVKPLVYPPQRSYSQSYFTEPMANSHIFFDEDEDTIYNKYY